MFGILNGDKFYRKKNREGDRVLLERYVCDFSVVREVLTEKVVFGKCIRLKSDQP